MFGTLPRRARKRGQPGELICLLKIRQMASHQREHFIPIRRADLLQRLATLVEPEHREAILSLGQILSATFHHQFHQRMESLKQDYVSLDPDRDTQLVEADHHSDTSNSDPATSFFDATIDLLERANFRRLSQDDIEAAMQGSSDWGVNLQVDFDLFDRLELYARGDVVQTRTRRRLRNRYREEQIELPVYQRLVLAFKLKPGNTVQQDSNPDQIYLKLFKDIPQIDLEMLLPGTRVRISKVDKGKILLPTMSGITLALIKIIKGVALLATATLTGLLSFLGILGGTVGYGVKSFLGYLRTKDKYHLNLTRSLYFQNLDNNAGVLHRLLDEAEEQETREALLGWFLLWQQAPEIGWTDEQLDDCAERFLSNQFDVDVDFEVEDALQKLDFLGLSRRDSEGRWTATPLAESLRRLDHAWDNLFQWNNDDFTDVQRVA